MMHRNQHDYKRHARACGPMGSRIWRTLCATPRPRLFADEGDTPTCRICLYQLGLYMPLVKLYEHQASNKVRYSFQKEFFYADA
jgi:hypothetical protein